MSRNSRWNIAVPSDGVAELAQRLKTSTLIAQMLVNRGISEQGDCENFLRPTLKSLHEPSLIPNLVVAAERIAKGIRDGEKIVIYGDYDVDGITATAILWHAIRELGGVVEYYIPHRIEEGYGLNGEAVAQICEGGAKLIVTVDCGVTAIEPARIAKERGVDLIITDHHEFKYGGGSSAGRMDEDGGLKPALPECFAVVHPRFAGSKYPNPNLCGAGVAFKLAWAVGLAVSGANRVSESFRAFLMEALALAALGTIADVVPLVGENRVIAHYGLGNLKRSKLTGIGALIKSANLDGQNLDSYHVGFLLAPRLNACGRMGHARLAAEMMTTATAQKAEEIAAYLEEQNRARQAIEKEILEQAIAQAEELKCGEENCRGIVLGKAGWHPGVIGIVASRIVERFSRPTIMVALSDEIGQGSGRSIAGFHLAQALDACGEFLESHGGHEMAAGLKVLPPNFEKFREAFCEHAGRVIEPHQLVPELKLDSLAELEQVTEALVGDLKRLGPFGHGNRKPLLCCRGVTLASPPRRVGKAGDHLQLFVRQGETAMKCIAFGAGELFDKLQQGMRLDLAVEPQINEFNGFTNVELAVKDLQIA